MDILKFLKNFRDTFYEFINDTYISNSSILNNEVPEEFKNLFNDTASKSGPSLIQKIKQYLEKR